MIFAFDDNRHHHFGKIVIYPLCIAMMIAFFIILFTEVFILVLGILTSRGDKSTLYKR